MQDANQEPVYPENPPVGAVNEPVVAPLPPSQTTQPVQTSPASPHTTIPIATTTPSATSSDKPGKEKRDGGILSFVGTLIVAFILVQVINMFLFQSYKVFGSSMYSTLHDGDRLIISKVSRTKSKITGQHFIPKRGQIIVFVDPQNPDLQLIKRVIGLPGEHVVVKNEKITVYNKEHPEGFNPDDAPYGKNLPPTTGEKDMVVPDDQIFVSGDNRAGSNSLDSRNELGTVPDQDIIGILKVRIFPFDNSRFF